MRKEKEIGSEFWSGCTPTLDYLYTMRPDYIYSSQLYKIIETLSGRTALEHIVESLCGRDIKKAYLPCYCCHTMIEPFKSQGMEILFYDVEWTGNCLHRVIDLGKDSEVILLLDYFGHTDEETFEIALEAKKKGKMVIYDATHAMYSQVDYSPYDFIYGSYRKWVDINCGFVAWKKDLYHDEITQSSSNSEYASLRTELFDKKALYMSGGKIDKEDFLPLIEEAELTLERIYHHQKPDERSLEVLKETDAEYLKRKRVDNARMLTEALNNINDERIQCINPILKTSDTPLFVPVMVTPVHRNPLRRYLIEHDIYCPVHWPLSELHQPLTGSKRLFDSELSLICDQRYNEKDIMRIVETIKKYLQS